MNIFAHRGIFDRYPENSFRALKQAFESKFSVETDLRLTKDNDFILIHDDNLKRLCGKAIAVNSLTIDELKMIHYIDENKELKDTIVPFRDFCEMFNKKSLDLLSAIQIKADSQTEIGLKKVSEYFDEFNLYEKAFAFDLTKDAAKRLRNINAKIKIALIVSEFKFESTIYLWEEIKNFDFDIVWAAEYRKLYTREWLEEVKNTGRKIFAISPDVHKAAHILHPRAYNGYKKTWKDLLLWKVDGICTDLPFELLNFIKSE